jgi:hypothetical protein
MGKAFSKVFGYGQKQGGINASTVDHVASQGHHRPPSGSIMKFDSSGNQNGGALGMDEEEDNTPRVVVSLVPHQHTLFCERKHKVCDAMGKFQELEVLQVDFRCPNVNKPKHLLPKGVWVRCLLNKSNEAALKKNIHQTMKELDTKGFQPIPNSEGKAKLTLTAQDVGYYIAFKLSSSAGAGADDLRINSIGPVVAGPARLYEDSLRVVGVSNGGGVEGPLCVGGRAVALASYVGGLEGGSEYWWMKVKDGQRESLTDPKALTSAHVKMLQKSDLVNLRSDDPRVFQIRPEDVGWTFKVKCRPIRSDGYRGDVFTSLPSSVAGQ